MKICHLTSVHPYKDTRIFYKECCTLVENGHEVFFIVPNAPSENINGIQVVSFETPKGNRFFRMTKTTDQVYKKALEVNADVYHFHDPELIPIGLKLKKNGKKVIYDVHEDLPRQILTKTWIPKLARVPISKVSEVYENYAARKFDYIITATPFIRDRFLKQTDSVIDINNFPLLHELNIEEVNWNKKGDYVCYVGGISFARGIKEMVQALEHVGNVKLLLGGTFLYSSERNEVVNYKEWKNVDELGFLDRQGVKEVYRKSKIGLVTLHPKSNYLDSLPIKMFEYMAAGIPVIASDFPLWRSIIEENNCGICVDPLSPQKIAEAINWLLKHPDLAEELGKNGRIAVEKMYNWEQEGKKLVKVYDKLSNM